MLGRAPRGNTPKHTPTTPPTPLFRCPQQTFHPIHILLEGASGTSPPYRQYLCSLRAMSEQMGMSPSVIRAGHARFSDPPPVLPHQVVSRVVRALGIRSAIQRDESTGFAVASPLAAARGGGGGLGARHTQRATVERVALRPPRRSTANEGRSPTPAGWRATVVGYGIPGKPAMPSVT